MADAAGTRLGKYELKEKLGKGGMAEVYKAYHQKLDRYVTIKILHSHLIEGDGFLARFEREARAVASLRHPHIVQIHDYDHESEKYYMVMELVDGGTLKDRIAEYTLLGGYMPVDEVLAIFQQMAEALDYAHTQGIIHRDVKPSNVLLDKAGSAFLTDFGIARIMSDVQVTATGALIGTPMYMSPEQGKGEELTNASDVYSLGIVLFEMLTGNVPFYSETPLAVIHKHIVQPLPNAAELRPGIPPQVQTVLNKAMAKQPADRYQNCQEFYEALALAISAEDSQFLDGSRSEGQVIPELFTTVVNEDPIEPDIPATATEGTENEPPEELKEKVSTKKAATRVDNKEAWLLEKKAELGDTALHEPELFRWRLDKNKLIFYLGAAAIVIIIAIVLFNAFGGGSGICSSVGECVDISMQHWEQEEWDQALDYYDTAIRMVPPEEHPDFAWLWFDRAGMMDHLGNHSEADANRAMGEAWERGE